jgi:hypothetical protein
MTMRLAIEKRYPDVFRWLLDFKRETVTRHFAEHGGKRKYFDGLKSSDLNKRQRALIAGVRWVLRYS